jgi:hypothetical protein
MKINKTVLNGILEKLVNLSNGTSIKFSRDEHRQHPDDESISW